jgi:hypothetical protein
MFGVFVTPQNLWGIFGGVGVPKDAPNVTTTYDYLNAARTRRRGQWRVLWWVYGEAGQFLEFLFGQCTPGVAGPWSPFRGVA